jgi:alcohol dehydrogenase class IV
MHTTATSQSNARPEGHDGERAWSFQAAGRIVCGAGSLGRLGELLQQLGIRHALLVTDRNLAVYAGRVLEAAARHGIACTRFDEGEPEPSVAVVERLLRMVDGQRFDGVLGLGGGSNIDVAKAAAVLLSHGGSIADYAGQGRVPNPILPVVAIPTTAGSGSEVSGACVLGVPGDRSKVAVVDNQLRPVLALVDPELHRSCPLGVTRDAGIDALCHAVEAYTIADSGSFPRDPAAPWPLYQGKHPFTDVLAERAIALIAANLPRAVCRPGDLGARAAMALGALLAGMAMSNTGLYTVHALAYPVGAFTGASHGACNGVLLPAVLDFIAPARPAEMRRIVELMRSERASAGDAVRDLLRAVGAPMTLRELGLTPAQIGPAAGIGYGIRRLMDGSPRPTSADELLAIVRDAYGDAA